MKIIFADSGCDLPQIKGLGFDTLLGYFNAADLDAMQALGLGCILAGEYIDHPAIRGYYLYDEPDLNNIPLADQDATVAAWRAKTTKPLAISCIEQATRRCSDQFDWYLLDIYYINRIGCLNYANLKVSPFIFRLLYPGKTVIPIMGLFDDNTEYQFDNEQLPFARTFRAVFRATQHQAIFVWKGYSDTMKGIVERPQYKQWALQLNTEQPQKISAWADTLYSAAARILLTGYRLLPKNTIALLNRILPQSLKIN